MEEICERGPWLLSSKNYGFESLFAYSVTLELWFKKQNNNLKGILIFGTNLDSHVCCSVGLFYNVES